MVRQGPSRALRRGAVAPLAALLMIVMLAMVAFAVDIGYIVLARSEAQNAADAGAMAGLGKLADRLQGTKLTNGKPVQTQADLDAARAEAKSFALKNTVGGQGADVKDAEVEFGYMSDPYNQSSSLDTTGLPLVSLVPCRRSASLPSPAMAPASAAFCASLRASTM